MIAAFTAFFLGLVLNYIALVGIKVAPFDTTKLFRGCFIHFKSIFPKFMQNAKGNIALAVINLGFYLASNYLAPDLSPLLIISFSSLLILMARVDFKIQIIPDVFTFPLLLIAFIAASMQQSLVSMENAVFGAAFGYFMPLFLSLIVGLATSKDDAIGFGDLKLLAAIGAVLGFYGLNASIFGSFIIFWLYCLKRNKKSAPLAPFLAISALIAWFAVLLKVF